MRIRTATPADADEMVQIRTAAWRAAYAGLVDAEVLAGLPEEASERYVRHLAEHPDLELTLVAEKGPYVIGFAVFTWDRTESSEEDAGPGVPGDVRMLYVHPDHWSRGTGRALMREGERWLTEQGLLPIRVWELEGNEVSRRFYTRYGFVPDGERRTEEISGAELPCARLTLPKDHSPDD
ncbi:MULTISPECIES: GNAT family N-acetyltransferase [Glycomyces]|jgi:GNAT superfamily N-acetyltransferase|uniref:GNAT family N-acetyltransferase n=2 Tax=Glycomyces TaxID=58113 RepID=A0A9X3PJ72_9ACTN|nr:GNAT family N-acetyltransferase [Glycomyces lechevalierae]MDA1386496.1 GNAT family N-acetyltransferase [Glycomyces lechevalierae]MDR7339013.1 GNAT superfamily N-acetyltransferase [Glycomyces lechevalierae]